MLVPVTLAVALVVAGALFASFGSAVSTVDRDSLAERAAAGDRRAAMLTRLFDDKGIGLAEARLGAILCALAVGSLIEPYVDRAVGIPGNPLTDPSRGWSVALVVLAAAAIQVVLGEMVARSVGAQRPMGTLMAIGVPVGIVTRGLAPLAGGAEAVARRVVGAFGTDRSAVLSRMQSRKELLRLVQLSERSGAIRAADANLLERTLRFGEKRAADALTPRVEVEALPLDGTVADLVERSAATGFSRFPVQGEDMDDIVGIVHVKDVLGVPPERRHGEPLSALLRRVHAVPESKDLESLMIELRDADGQFAVVVDEYGGTAGIVTLEDLIEEIVGDIADEHDPALAAPAVRRWAGAHVLSGSLHPDEVAEACDFQVPEGDYETIAGFVLSEMGCVPEEGDGFEHDGWDLEVVEMDGQRIRAVKLVAPSPGSLGSMGPDAPHDAEQDASR